MHKHQYRKPAQRLIEAIRQHDARHSDGNITDKEVLKVASNVLKGELNE